MKGRKDDRDCVADSTLKRNGNQVLVEPRGRKPYFVPRNLDVEINCVDGSGVYLVSSCSQNPRLIPNPRDGYSPSFFTIHPQYEPRRIPYQTRSEKVGPECLLERHQEYQLGLRVLSFCASIVSFVI